MSKRLGWVLGVTGCIFALGGISAAIATSRSGSLMDGIVVRSGPSQKQAAAGALGQHHHRRPQHSGYRLFPHGEPAHIVGDPEPLVGDTVMYSVTNAWRVSTRRRLTIVEAGKAAGGGSSSSDGLFVVYREVERPFSQKS